MLQVRLFPLSICLGFGPAFLLSLGQNSLGVESGGSHLVLGRYPILLSTSGNGQTGHEVPKTEPDDDPQDSQSYRHAIAHRGPSSGIETGVPSP